MLRARKVVRGRNAELAAACLLRNADQRVGPLFPHGTGSFRRTREAARKIKENQFFTKLDLRVKQRGVWPQLHVYMRSILNEKAPGSLGRA